MAKLDECQLTTAYLVISIDTNTIGSVAAIASIDWGCAVQIMAAATIGSNQQFSPTNAQTLYVMDRTHFFLGLDRVAI